MCVAPCPWRKSRRATVGVLDENRRKVRVVDRRLGWRDHLALERSLRKASTAKSTVWPGRITAAFFS
jgi:hypothetical protein